MDSTSKTRNEQDRKRDKITRALKKERRIRVKGSFEYGRRNALSRLLMHVHDRPCLTDDAVVWWEAVAPFIVEATIRSGRSPHFYTWDWAGRCIPLMAEEIGSEGLGKLVDELIAEREAAPVDSKGRPIWLPAMPELVRMLRITRQKREEVGLRGFGCLDPLPEEEARERNRDRMRLDRLVKGVVPQEMRTKTKEAEAEAARLGISLTTLKRRRRKVEGHDLEVCAP